MKTYYQGIWLVLATAVISGISIFLNKFGVTGIEPSLFAGLKNAAVGIVLVAVILAAKEFSRLKSLRARQWLKLVLIGLIGGSLPFILFFNGLSLTSGAKAGFIHKTMFLYVALLSVLFLKEKISRKAVWGYLAMFAGLIMFVGIKPQALGWGDVLVLIATSLWAVEIIISKKLLTDISANIVAAGRMFFGGAVIWLYLLIQGKAGLVFTLNVSAWVWLLVTVIMLAGYVLTFYHGLKRIPAQEATAILSLGAPITLLLTMVVSGVTVTVSQLAGIVLILFGLIYIFIKLRPVAAAYVLPKHN